MLRRYISWKQGLIEGQRRARHIVSLLKEPNGASSVDDFEAVFFDDGIGEHFFGNALQLFLSFVAVPAIEIQDEEFALADIFHGGVTKAGKSVLDGLSLRIEDSALRHDPNVCFHARIIAKPRPRRGRQRGERSAAVLRPTSAPVRTLPRGARVCRSGRKVGRRSGSPLRRSAPTRSLASPCERRGRTRCADWYQTARGHR